MSHIAVIGAGVIGVTTAYALIQRGYEVTLIERNRYPAMETSFANGGQLSACNAEVWNSWPTIAKGMLWMMRRDAPLLMNPWPSVHKYGWIAEFMSQIPNYKANTLRTARMAIAARSLLTEIADREHIEFDYVSKGILHIYRDKDGFDTALAVNKLLAEAGLERSPVTSEEMRSIEPTLAGKYYGGMYTPSDSTGDIHKFTVQLAEACERKGVRRAFGHTVTGISKRTSFQIACRSEDSGELEVTADGVVICAGTASKHLASMLGDRVNIYPVKGYSITVHLEDDGSREAAPWTSLLDESTKIVSSRLGKDRFRVAGTAEFNGGNRDIVSDRITPLLNWTRTLFPGVSTKHVVPWAGLRPMMPDMLPTIRRGRQKGVFYNTGHGHLGWTLAPVTAQMLAETVEGEL